MDRRRWMAQMAASAAGVPLAWSAAPARAADRSAVLWVNDSLKAAIENTATQATIAARAIFVTYEAVYNAWAAYQWQPYFTVRGLRKRPTGEWNDTWTGIAIGFAAQGVLSDLFPTQRSRFDAAIDALIPNDLRSTPAGQAAIDLGRDVAAAVLAVRQRDGSNQVGDLAAGRYTDYTDYRPVNTPDEVVDLARWQPLRVPTASGGSVVQQYLTPHWGRVRTCAVPSGSALRPDKPTRLPTQAEVDELITKSAQLDDTTKSLVHYWAANPGTVSPPGQWLEIAEQVSAYDQNTLDDDVMLFFTVGQAVHDAAITAWDCKRAYDSVRPITTIRTLYRGQTIAAWGGSGLGTQYILGEDWRPYQRVTNPTPPFPEYVSGHSTFSRAASAAIASLRGSDRVPLSFTVTAGEIAFDENTPPTPVTFQYGTLTEAALAAGISRLWGGIHYASANLDGRRLGYSVAQYVTARTRRLLNGRRYQTDRWWWWGW